tara:strand:+ start:374 stop:589 length:216 start_codon:yes stop_codon:yes gene_type:complete
MAEGKAAKSASGASMSKYDVEVEARLKAIEAEISSIKEGLKSHGHGGGNGCAHCDARMDDLLERLGRKMKF